MSERSDPPDFVDDRARQGTLDVGDAAARTARRAEREGEIAGSEAFVDAGDVPVAPDVGDQASLVETQETLEGQASLGGGEATIVDSPEWGPQGSGAGDDWQEAFDVPDEEPAPEYVGEWERQDDEPFLTYADGDGMVARVRPTASGDGRMVVYENHYSEAEDPSETVETYYTDSADERAKRTLITWIKANTPADALEKLPAWASDRDAKMAHFTPEDRGRIKHHAETGDMESLLRSIGADTRMGMAQNFADAGIYSIGDFVGRDDFTDVEGVGPKTSEKIEAAVPLIEEGLYRAGWDPQSSGADVAGSVVVGNNELEVPRPFGGWETVEFASESIGATDDRGTIAAYVSPDRMHSVVVDGTAVSNKWGVTAYAHREPIPDNPGPLELRYGPGGADSESERWQITYGNVVDGSAERLLDDNLPTLEEVRSELGTLEARSGAEEWADAVAYLRDHYGDDYGDRVELGRDLSKFASEQGYPSVSALGDEGVLQPLIRYQDIPADDVYRQIERRVGETDADLIQEIIMEFAAHGASRYDGSHEKEKLMQVEGIGEKRAETLLEEFGDVGGVSRATTSWNSIASLEGFSSETARNLFDRMQEAGVYEGTPGVTPDVRLRPEAEEVTGGERWRHTETDVVWWVSPSNEPDAALMAENEQGDVMYFEYEIELLESKYWEPIYAPSVGVDKRSDGNDLLPAVEDDVFAVGPSPIDVGEFEMLDVNGEAREARELVGTALGPQDFTIDDTRVGMFEVREDLVDMDEPPADALPSSPAVGAADPFVEAVEENIAAAQDAGVLDPDPNGDEMFAPSVPFAGPESDREGYGSTDYLYLPAQAGGWERTRHVPNEVVYLRDRDDGGFERVRAQLRRNLDGWAIDKTTETGGGEVQNRRLGWPGELRTAREMRDKLKEIVPIGEPASQQEPEPVADEPGMIEIEFGSLDAANTIRDEYPHILDSGDKRTTKTVRIDPYSAPDDLVDDISIRAADSRSDVAEQFGQEPLTDYERGQLEQRSDWNGSMLFHARSAKAILTGKGVDDWLSYYDPQLSTDEHRGVAERARQDEAGARLDETARAGFEDAMIAGAAGFGGQAERNARDTVIEMCMEISNEKDPAVFDAILSGEDPGVSTDRVRRARETIEDVRAEFGHEFVEQAAEECRREREALPPVDPNPVMDAGIGIDLEPEPIEIDPPRGGGVLDPDVGVPGFAGDPADYDPAVGATIDVWGTYPETVRGVDRPEDVPEPYEPVDFHRARDDGRFTAPRPVPDPSVENVDRSAETGQFVTREREAPGVVRDGERNRWTAEAEIRRLL